MKAAETGVCDVEGNCLCSGEREDPDQIFENNSDDKSGDDDVGVGIFMLDPSYGIKHTYYYQALPSFLRNVIFLPLSRSYFFRSRSNLMNPSYFDLPNAVNFYIPVNDEGDAIGNGKHLKCICRKELGLFSRCLVHLAPRRTCFLRILVFKSDIDCLHARKLSRCCFNIEAAANISLQTEGFPTGFLCTNC